MSIFQSPGERGKVGDHGQDGKRGERGLPGVAGDPGPRGLPGEAGRGGATGKTGRANRDWPQLVAFLFIGALGVVGFAYVQGEQERLARVVDFQCEQAEERRGQIRDLTIAVGSLGRDLTNSGSQQGDPNPRREALIERLEKFEIEQLEKINQTTPCPPEALQ